DEVTHRLPALLKDAHERGDLYKATFLRTRIAYAPHLAADEPARAREEVRRGIEGWSHGGFQLEHCWTLLCEADIAMYEGGTLASTLVRAQWRAAAPPAPRRAPGPFLEAADRLPPRT